MREIVLDTETTGLDPLSGHRLIELACIELRDLIPTGRTFHRYIDPEREIGQSHAHRLEQRQVRARFPFRFRRDKRG